MKKKTKAELILTALKSGKKVSNKSVKFTNPSSLSSQISKFRKMGMNIVCNNGLYLLVFKNKK